MQQAFSLTALIRENSWYFIGFLIFLIVGAILLYTIDTGDAVIYFSERRSTFGDFFFKYGTKIGEAGIYFVIVFILLFVRYRYAIIVPLLGLSVSITTYILKDFFGHDRPSLFFRRLGQLDELTLIEGVRLNGGTNSFPSGHTMSAFAIFTFLAFCWPMINKKLVGFLCFLVALMVGISRIYLVQHFLKDVYLGAIIGLFLSILWYYLASLPKRPWLDKRLERRQSVNA
jgi:membrane-associated phospholipid phosphatase